MANTSQEKLQAYLGDSTLSITFYSSGTTAMISGYIQPDPQSYSIVPIGETRLIEHANGEIGSIRSKNQGVRCTIQFRPHGGSNADLLKSVTMPQYGFTAAISGMPVWQIGPYADAWNVTQATGHEMWHVTEITEMSGSPQDPQMYSVTMVRCLGITGNTPVS
jgi:hypothetical protein